MASIAQNAARVLALLVERSGKELAGKEIVDSLGLTPEEVNDAVTILVENGYAEWMRFLGTRPFEFGLVSSTARGRYEFERQQQAASAAPPPAAPGRQATEEPLEIRRPPTPIGSPYGFSDEDWEIVAEHHAAQDTLHVVLGHQWESPSFNTERLRSNVRQMFERAVTQYNAQTGAVPSRLSFTPLAAGYGEHLFNEIARDIISADIAVFDTSDLNPNVMLEMGVALTWGVRVLAIKQSGCPKPPSDVSGQTWADYSDSAAVFLDTDHERKLLRMVDRAIRKKGRA